MGPAERQTMGAVGSIVRETRLKEDYTPMSDG